MVSILLAAVTPDPVIFGLTPGSIAIVVVSLIGFAGIIGAQIVIGTYARSAAARAEAAALRRDQAAEQAKKDAHQANEDAVKAQVAAVEAQAGLLETARQLVLTIRNTDATLAEIKAKGEATHALVNSAYTFQLQELVFALGRVASDNPDDPRAKAEYEVAQQKLERQLVSNRQADDLLATSAALATLVAAKSAVVVER